MEHAALPTGGGGGEGERGGEGEKKREAGDGREDKEVELMREQKYELQ